MLKSSLLSLKCGESGEQTANLLLSSAGSRVCLIRLVWDRKCIYHLYQLLHMKKQIFKISSSHSSSYQPGLEVSIFVVKVMTSNATTPPVAQTGTPNIQKDSEYQPWTLNSTTQSLHLLPLIKLLKSIQNGQRQRHSHQVRSPPLPFSYPSYLKYPF